MILPAPQNHIFNIYLVTDKGCQSKCNLYDKNGGNYEKVSSFLSFAVKSLS
jgi:hypothetical protein